MTSISAPRRRYYAVRARKVFFFIVGPMLAFFVFFEASVMTDSQIDRTSFALSMAPFLVVLIVLVIRSIYALNLDVSDSELVYRTTFRTQRLSKDSIEHFGVENRQNGWLKLPTVIVYKRDGTSLALVIFSSLRPNPEINPNPNGFRRVNDMVADLNGWLDSQRPSLTT